MPFDDAEAPNPNPNLNPSLIHATKPLDDVDRQHHATKPLDDVEAEADALDNRISLEHFLMFSVRRAGFLGSLRTPLALTLTLTLALTALIPQDTISLHGTSWD